MKIFVEAGNPDNPYLVADADVGSYAGGAWVDCGTAPASLDGYVWNPATLSFQADLSDYTNEKWLAVRAEGNREGAVNLYENETLDALSFKLYLMLEVLAFAGDAAPVASNYPFLESYATNKAVPLSDAYIWAKERVLTGWKRAANHLGYRELLFDQIFAAADVAAIDAVVASVDWVNNALDATPDGPADVPTPMRMGGGSPSLQALDMGGAAGPSGNILNMGASA